MVAFVNSIWLLWVNIFTRATLACCVLSWFMRHTRLRSISDREKDNLYLLLDDSDSGYRAKIILLKDEGYTVPEIRQMTNHHDNNIRKWIHRFNDCGIDGIISKKHNHPAQNYWWYWTDSPQGNREWDFLHGHYVF